MEKFLAKKKFVRKETCWENNFCQKKFFREKILLEKYLSEKKNLLEKQFLSEKNLLGKNFIGKKNYGKFLLSESGGCDEHDLICIFVYQMGRLCGRAWGGCGLDGGVC